MSLVPTDRDVAKRALRFLTIDSSISFLVLAISTAGMDAAQGGTVRAALNVVSSYKAHGMSFTSRPISLKLTG